MSVSLTCKRCHKVSRAELIWVNIKGKSVPRYVCTTCRRPFNR